MSQRLPSVVHGARSCCALAIAAGQCSAAPLITAVIRTGDPAPGIAAGVVQSLPRLDAGLNNADQVAFYGQLQIGTGGVTIGNDQAIWRYTPSSGHALVARGADPIPAIPGKVYDENSPAFLGNGCMNAAGEIVLKGGISGTSRDAFVINGTSVVRTGNDDAPGLPAGTVISVLNAGQNNPARINDSSQVLYTTQLSGPGVTAGNNTVMYLDDTVIAREGDSAPGTGASFGSFLGADSARLNSAGQVAFTNDLATGVASNNGVVCRASGGAVTVLARDGDPAPGTGGAAFGSSGFRSARINSSGAVSYLGELSNGDNTLYVDATLRARDGDPAPSLPGLTLKNVGGSITGTTAELNDSGSVLFFSSLNGPGVNASNSSALYLDSTLIARAGAAGPVPGSTYSGFNISDLALNNAGQAVFLAGLTGPGITGANDLALLFWDGSSVSVLVREGDVIAGDTVGVLIGADTAPKFELNDNGTVLFYARLADGRDGLYEAIVPGPGAGIGALAVFGGLGSAAPRRRSPPRAKPAP